MRTKHALEAVTKMFGYRLVKKNYVSRMETHEPASAENAPALAPSVPQKKSFVPHQKREKQGTKEYKNGSMYLYCTPEDKAIAHQLAIERGCSMKELLHEMLTVAAVNKVKIHADPHSGSVPTVQPLMPKDPIPVIPADQIRTMKASEFFDMFLLGPMDRWEQQKQEKSGDKK
jgi:hypothetical protein